MQQPWWPLQTGWNRPATRRARPVQRSPGCVLHASPSCSGRRSPPICVRKRTPTSTPAPGKVASFLPVRCVRHLVGWDRPARLADSPDDSGKCANRSSPETRDATGLRSFPRVYQSRPRLAVLERARMDSKRLKMLSKQGRIKNARPHCSRKQLPGRGKIRVN